MPDKSYPEGVTSMDHIRHDMKMGRFPNQSSVETFLKERAMLAAQEDAALLPGGASLHDEMVEALKEAEDLICGFQNEVGEYSEDSYGGMALRKIRSVLAKATGSKPEPV